MAGTWRVFSGTHRAISALLDHPEVSPGVSGPVCLPLLPFLGSLSAFSCPRLDIACGVAQLRVDVVMNIMEV